jgi:hypothetical protein
VTPPDTPDITRFPIAYCPESNLKGTNPLIVSVAELLAATVIGDDAPVTLMLKSLFEYPDFVVVNVDVTLPSEFAVSVFVKVMVVLAAAPLSWDVPPRFAWLSTEKSAFASETSRMEITI